MASTTAMFTGLSGLTAHARNLDVIGNNIANANTTAFKSNRMMFASQFSRTFSLGSAPSADFGGTNPGQVGLGVAIAGTQRDFTGGALSTTGDQRDLAIEGDGFFVVERDGQRLYTRDGSFRQNSVNELVTIGGDRVQGFAVDEEFNIVEGALTNLTIPTGTLTLAQATRNVHLTGNLNAAGPVGMQGTRIGLSPLSLLGGPIGGPGGDVLTPESLLTQVEDPESPGEALFRETQTLELTGARRGSRLLPESSLGITGQTTVADLIEFLRASLGIHLTGQPNPDGFTPGVSLDPATGEITVVGNTGTVNDIELRTGSLRLRNSDGEVVGNPFTMDRRADADGEAVRTTFVVHDSLGSEVNVDVSFVLDGRSDAGTSWRVFLESGGNQGADPGAGTGLVQFDPTGQIVGPTNIGVLLSREGTGAETPLEFDVDLASSSGAMTALADSTSAVASTFQDGAPIGTLAAYSVGVDGVITGAFSNGLTRTIGQVALATFSNPEGLEDIGSNLFRVGPNSGTPVVTAPTVLGAGRVIGGALEQSNVDLAEQFINLILTSTGYSASSRVINTTDQLLQQLLVIGR